MSESIKKEKECDCSYIAPINIEMAETIIGYLKSNKEEAQATPQPHPCEECNKYGCDVHCPYYGK